MGIGAILAGGSVVSGIFGASSAQRGAEAQADAALEGAQISADTQLEMFDRSVELQEPWRQAGMNALEALNYNLGLGPSPTFNVGGTSSPLAIQTIGGTANPQANTPYYGQGDARGLVQQQNPATAGVSPTQYVVGGQTFGNMADAENYANANAMQTGGDVFEYQGFEQSPGYQYMLDEGENAIMRGAAAQGSTLGGATLRRLQEHGMGLANQDFNNYVNQLSGIAGTGQSSAGALGSQAVSTGQNIGGGYANAYNTAGAARASGYAGVNSALQGTMNNLASIGGYAQSGMFGANPGFGITPNPSGLTAYGY